MTSEYKEESVTLKTFCNVFQFECSTGKQHFKICWFAETNPESEDGVQAEQLNLNLG